MGSWFSTQRQDGKDDPFYDWTMDYDSNVSRYPKRSSDAANLTSPASKEPLINRDDGLSGFNFSFNDPMAHTSNRNHDTVDSRSSTVNAKETSRTESAFPGRSSVVHVSNLNFDIVTMDELEAHFSCYGEVEAVKLLTKRGVAFIQFKTVAGADKAIEFCRDNGVTIEGRMMEVARSKFSAISP